MTASAAETTEWPGPTRFLPPPEPRVETDGSKRYEGVTYAAVLGYRPLQLDLWVPRGDKPTSAGGLDPRWRMDVRRPAVPSGDAAAESALR